MSRSEIFDSFIKIAQEKGMISNDSNEAKKKLEKTHRADSLSISDIEALYGVKPNSSKGMEYEHNIMENAHPNSVIVSPSYDKINGLVENNNERQNIILNILNKTPDGLLTNRKYAEQQFLSALVSVANDLDNRNEDKLRVLADACLMQTYSKNKKLKKEALAPLAIAGLVAVPLVLGALYLQQHMSMINEGYEKNHEKLIAELDGLLNSSSSWGVGVDYKAPLIEMATNFKSKLMTMHNLFKQFEPLINDLEKPRTATELVAISKQPKTDSVLKAFRAFYNESAEMSTYVKTIQKDFASESFKSRQTANKGILSSLMDKTQILHGGYGLFADDFDDVNHAIPPYQASIKEILDIFSGAKSIVDEAKKTLDASKSEQSKLYGADMQAPAESPEATAPVAPGNKPENELHGLNTDLSSIFGR